MTDHELNKFLQERVMVECWHENIGTFESPRCSCGGWFSNEHWQTNPDFLNNPSDYWRLIQKIGEEGLIAIYEQWKKNRVSTCFTWMMFNQRRGCEAIVEFWKSEA